MEEIKYNSIETNTFRVHIFECERQNVYFSLSDGVLNIAFPLATDLNGPAARRIILTVLQKALRHEAKRTLPARLASLASAHGFTYARLRIANTRSRWGSCSSEGNINLSLSIMLLPDNLLDYVILHELCHTVEMNHSKRFWDLMDTVTDSQARLLKKQLSAYRPLHYL
ncbi:MAG: M48 family metallopeptidase [Tannerellaceae bacterium]|jgi:predicted metal-dependent hydrolase|nr:M48 family metallopeptidase [Tannerellaceae bacterium]